MSVAVSASASAIITSSSGRHVERRRSRPRRATTCSTESLATAGARQGTSGHLQLAPSRRRSSAFRHRTSAGRSESRSGVGSGGFDDATREVYRQMGVGPDEDEFAFETGPEGDGEGLGERAAAGEAGAIRNESEFEGDDSLDGDGRRVFRDASMEENNDIVARLINLFKYVVIVRCGTELPVKYFDLPSDAGVGGNVFSEFVNSIVPTGASVGLNTGIPWFHVGIGPFIAASIAMSVLVAVIPSLKALQKDAVGQQTVKQYTRYLMLVVAVVQSFVTAAELKPYTVLTSHYYWQVVPMFITGALVVAWLGDEMTNYGIGNGTSVMITMSVCGAYFSAAKYYAPAITAASLTAMAPFIGAAVLLTAGAVLVQTGTCKVPLLYFQGPSIPGLPRVVRKEIDHIPFKVNPLGIQPVLVAVFMCEGMNWLAKQGGGAWFQAFVGFFFNSSSWMYYVTFFLIVFGFSYLDLQDTPKEVSEYMVKIGARIPDIRPGEQTVKYLEQLQDGSRFFGGLLLGTVAVACTIMDNYMRATTGVCIGFTSMLIVTSTILQMKRQVSALAQMPRLDKVMQSL